MAHTGSLCADIDLDPTPVYTPEFEALYAEKAKELAVISTRRTWLCVQNGAIRMAAHPRGSGKGTAHHTRHRQTSSVLTSSAHLSSHPMNDELNLG